MSPSPERNEFQSMNSLQNLTPSMLQLDTLSSSSSTSQKSSLFHYRNPRLEKILHTKQNKSQLSINSMELVDQDMEIFSIIIYYKTIQ